jgi:FkbM family methyltransferase
MAGFGRYCLGMNRKVWLMRKVGIKLLGSETTLTNILVKKILLKFNIKEESRLYKLARRSYRRTGKVSKFEPSFSSFGEDRVLVKYLPELDGSYIDVGAGAPINGSNTYFLYQRGWRGVTIEPIVTLVNLHRIKRPADTQKNACITDQIGSELTFYQYLADDFSTDSIDRVSELEALNIHPQKTYSSPTMTLSELEHLCNPLLPSFLNIDVEGSELNVLKSNNWKLCKPRVIAIEEWESPIYFETEVRAYLETLNYRLTSRCFLTSIYVHFDYLNTISEKKELNFQWYKP